MRDGSWFLPRGGASGEEPRWPERAPQSSRLLDSSARQRIFAYSLLFKKDFIPKNRRPLFGNPA
jgi:hypothetical protein